MRGEGQEGRVGYPSHLLIICLPSLPSVGEHYIFLNILTVNRFIPQSTDTLLYSCREYQLLKEEICWSRVYWLPELYSKILSQSEKVTLSDTWITFSSKNLLSNKLLKTRKLPKLLLRMEKWLDFLSDVGDPISQGVINHPRHSEMIRPRCMACPWHSANFKKKFKCVKMVVFVNMIFGMGRS